MKINETAAEYIVDKKGHKKGVLLTIEQYDQLMEDLHDLSVAAERKNDKTISLPELKRRLKKNGRL